MSPPSGGDSLKVHGYILLLLLPAVMLELTEYYGFSPVPYLWVGAQWPGAHVCWVILYCATSWCSGSAIIRALSDRSRHPYWLLWTMRRTGHQFPFFGGREVEKKEREGGQAIWLPIALGNPQYCVTSWCLGSAIIQALPDRSRHPYWLLGDGVMDKELILGSPFYVPWCFDMEITIRTPWAENSSARIILAFPTKIKSQGTIPTLLSWFLQLTSCVLSWPVLGFELLHLRAFLHTPLLINKSGTVGLLEAYTA